MSNQQTTAQRSRGQTGPPMKNLYDRYCIVCKRNGYQIPKTAKGRPLWHLASSAPSLNREEGQQQKRKGYLCKNCNYRSWYHSNPDPVAAQHARMRIREGILPKGVKQRRTRRKYYAGHKVKHH
jgi:hypothetical protein